MVMVCISDGGDGFCISGGGDGDGEGEGDGGGGDDGEGTSVPKNKERRCSIHRSMQQSTELRTLLSARVSK